MKKNKRVLSFTVILSLISVLLCGCAGTTSYEKNDSLDTSENVTLTIAGPNTDFKAIEKVVQEFNKIYPNCKVEYEYIQDYNDMLEKRFTSEEARVDIFLTDNIQSSSPFLPYAMELSSHSDMFDMSDTYEGLINNFRLQGTEEIYALPLGGEMRGLYVNKTLLKKLGIETPKNREEFLQACATLKENGYVPLQANPGSFGQQLIYPCIAHSIADAGDYEAVYNMINNCEEDAAEYFREPLQFLYDITAEGYFNYKFVETEYGTFTDGNNENSVRSFAGIVLEEDGTATAVPEQGRAAFMTGPNSMQGTLDKTLEDYHLDMEYEFILAPIGEEGGYAYMSPAKGIAINKNSTHTDWSLTFLDFLFSEKINKEFAEKHNVIPNTKDALNIISKKYDIPVEEISQPDDVTFDYGFYGLIVTTITDISKSTNPKYMKDTGDGNLVMYDFEYYMDGLKTLFTEQREGGEESAE